MSSFLNSAFSTAAVANEIITACVQSQWGLLGRLSSTCKEEIFTWLRARYAFPKRGIWDQFVRMSC